MKRPLVITTLCLVFLLVAAVGIVWLDREPVVAGQPVSYWVGELQQNSFDRSTIAKEHLKSAGGGAIEFLLRALEDENPVVRKARQLYSSAWSKAPHAMRNVLPFPRSGHIDRREVIGALGYLVLEHPQIIDSLVNELSSSDSELRFAVVTELGRARANLDLQVVPALIGALTNDPAANVRGRAAFSLADMGDPAKAAIPALLSSLSDPSPEVRWIAAKALGNLAPKGDSLAIKALEKQLHDTDEVARSYAAQAHLKLTGSPEPAVGVLTALIAKPESQNRHVAISLIGTMGPQAAAALPILSKTVLDSDEGLRLFSARALWVIAGETNQSLSTLRAVLVGGDRYHQIRATEFLGKMGSAALPALPELRIAAASNDLLVRRGAVVALGSVGSADHSTISVLENALKDPSPSVQEAARGALGTIQNGTR